MTTFGDLPVQLPTGRQNGACAVCSTWTTVDTDRWLCDECRKTPAEEWAAIVAAIQEACDPTAAKRIIGMVDAHIAGVVHRASVKP